MNGSSALVTALRADSSITALVESSAHIVFTSKNTFDPSLTTINVFDPVGVDNTQEAMFAEYTCNCRASTEKAARELAQAVVLGINRKEITGGGRFYCVTEAPIQPANDNDNFNSPVTVFVKSTFDLD